MRLEQAEQVGAGSERCGHDTSVQPRDFLDRTGDSERRERPPACRYRGQLYPHSEKVARDEQSSLALRHPVCLTQRVRLPPSENMERRAQERHSAFRKTVRPLLSRQ